MGDYMKDRKGLNLPKLISDGMILQRDQVIKLWGYADEGQNITIKFLDERYKVVADSNGRWQVNLGPLAAGGPYEMEFVADKHIIIHDILIGDIWLCGGQSNMELPVLRVMERYSDEVSSYQNPCIRMFRVPMVYDFASPLEELAGGVWQLLNQENVLDFTATGYFFAKALFAAHQVPIGLIHTALGGTPAEAWISEEGLKTFPTYLEEAAKYADNHYAKYVLDEDEKRIKSWQDDLDRADRLLARGEEQCAASQYDDQGWSVFNIPGFWNEGEMNQDAGAIWFRRQIDVPAKMCRQDARLLLGTIVDSDTIYLNGYKIGETGYKYPPRIYPIPEGVLKEGKNTLIIRVVWWQKKGGFTPDKPFCLQAGDDCIDLKGEWQYKIGAKMPELSPQIFLQYKPLGVYNGMIWPLRNMKLKGVIWYQGESNTHQPQVYGDLFRALIGDWRNTWQNQELPFIYVQLPNFDSPEESEDEKLLTKDNWPLLREAQLETLQVPNTGMAVAIDVGEWNDLHPLNKKDIGERLALHARAIAYHEDLVYSGPLLKEARIEEDKVVLSFNHVGSGLAILGEELKGFTISADGKCFVNARAQIREQQVVVWQESVMNPVEVRYGWENNPQQANLYNKEALPASPFRVSI